jgi:hypothetical protein
MVVPDQEPGGSTAGPWLTPVLPSSPTPSSSGIKWGHFYPGTSAGPAEGEYKEKDKRHTLQGNIHWYWIGGVLGGILILGLVLLSCFIWVGKSRNKRVSATGDDPRELQNVVVMNNDTYDGPAIPNPGQNEQVGTSGGISGNLGDPRAIRGGCSRRSVEDITVDHVYESARKRTPARRVLRNTPARAARAARALPATPIQPSTSLPNLMELDSPAHNLANLNPIALEFDPFRTSSTFPFVYGLSLAPAFSELLRPTEGGSDSIVS